MDISLVCVEDGIKNIGFRKFTGYVRENLDSEADVYFAAQGDNYRSYKKMIFGSYGQPPDHPEEHAERVAQPLAESDLVGLSCMTPFASFAKKVIKRIYEKDSSTFVVWGGIHPIVDPEDAIQHADAICTGEGEFAFEEFLTKYKAGKDYTDTKNFWFNRDGEIIRNPHRPLMSEEEMDSLPLPQYGEDEMIYHESDGFVPLTEDIYRSYNGLGYNVIWSIGCPLHCTFCSNTKFIENNSNYTQVRHPSPDYLVREIEQALERHPFISSVIIQDDSMMGLHPDTLRDFADTWKDRLDVPFTCMGVIPNYVTEEKMEILLDAGMDRLRMGIQNGSKEMLEFYERPAPPEKVMEAAEIFSKYQDYMIPPGYDVIVDNPVESRQNVVENLDFLRELPKPYGLNLFSLVTIPGTKLEKQLEERNLTTCHISHDTFPNLTPTLANCLAHIVATFPIPDWIYKKLRARAKPADEDQPMYPVLLLVVRLLHLIKRGLANIRHFKFDIIGGGVGYFLWKTGLLSLCRKYLKPDFSMKSPEFDSPQGQTLTSDSYQSAQEG